VILTLGGPERIRTAVEAFAELCLATRPQDLFSGHKNREILFTIRNSLNENQIRLHSLKFVNN
jgi:hypothetical protein